MMAARIAVCTALGLAALAAPAGAQTYPSRGITMVATFPAGGPTDGVARVLAQELSERFKQKVVVENRGGASGTIGAGAAAKSPPDGHTLLITSTGPLNYHRALYKSLSYDPVRDLTPVVMVGTIPQLIVLSPKIKAATLKEFIAYARANPGKVNIGDSGVGTTVHLLAVQVAAMAGLSVQHVHYRGAAGAHADVMGGQIDAAIAAFIPSAVNMKVGGVTWSERIKQLPNVPTFRESGLDIVSGLSLSLAVPAGTPRTVIDTVNRAVNEFLKGERGRTFETNYALQVAGGTPEEARDFLAAEADRLIPLIRKAKISLD